MPFKPGQSGNPLGRPKGGHNAKTTAIQAAYVDLINNNIGRVQSWLEEVAREDPAKALDILIRLSPFVIPKKTEADITIDNPIKIIMPPGNP